MRHLPDGYLIAWYGDDFTGSAATMEVLQFAGVPSVLFLDIPSEEQLARFPKTRAIGIASTARSHGPEWMEQNIPAPFAFLRDTGAPILHYKVCSTLDSAPHVGSIGKAIDLAAPLVGGKWIPCLLAAPQMRRYQAFGHLFAGSPQGVFRLDRHPVMSKHPVTPMDESDVALHLGKQTRLSFGLVSVEDLQGETPSALERELDNGKEIICLDAVVEAHMARCGELIWDHGNGQIFCVGSQGIEYALVSYWQDAGALPMSVAIPSAGPVERMIVVSGSVSPTTKMQIDWAAANGFAPIPLDVAAAVVGDKAAEDAACLQAHDALSRGLDPLIHSARGPDDPAISAMRSAVAASRVSADEANRRIGAALGRILARMLRDTGIRRAVISGGDTSGHASRELNVFAFTAIAPTIPGAALLRAHSDNPQLAGLQLALKGGQMGSEDYFGWIKRGGGAA